METVWTVLTHLIFLHLVKGSVMNVARNKPASVSSKRSDEFNAARAVDGNTNAVWPRGVIHTETGQPSAWWKVDLEREVQDATLKIYFRTDYTTRRNGVKICKSIMLFSSYPGQDCNTVVGDPSGSDIDDVISIPSRGRCRYLLVYTNTDNDGQGPVLDFGEVMVLVCSDGTYGENCIKTCNTRHCVTMATTCERNGRCPGGCQTGWRGVDCTQVCDSNFYGSGCSFLCSFRKCLNSGSSCDHVTGLCDGGCQSGYTGTNCGQKCPAGTFGVSCTSCSTRHCQRDLDCPEDGRCSQGCQDGWTPTTCTQACPSGSYGPGCNKTCGHCIGDNICNHVTGNCPGDC